MWLPTEITKAVDAIARVYYVDAGMCANWNAYRKEGELRMLTGWCWSSGDRHRQGFKTETVCYRDAYYALIKRTAAPISRRRGNLRVVA